MIPAAVLEGVLILEAIMFLLVIAWLCFRMSKLNYVLADLNRLVAAMCRARDIGDARLKATQYAKAHGYRGT